MYKNIWQTIHKNIKTSQNIYFTIRNTMNVQYILIILKQRENNTNLYMILSINKLLITLFFCITTFMLFYFSLNTLFSVLISLLSFFLNSQPTLYSFLSWSNLTSFSSKNSRHSLNFHSPSLTSSFQFQLVLINLFW